MENFIVVGRISGEDDKTKMVIAEDHEMAKSLFKNWLVSIDKWDGNEPIYIEHCQTIQEMEATSIKESTLANVKEAFIKTLSDPKSSIKDLPSVVAYFLALTCSPGDLVEIANFIVDDDLYEVDEDFEHITSGDNTFEYFYKEETKITVFHSLLPNIENNLERAVIAYNDANSLLEVPYESRDNWQIDRIQALTNND